jgi:transcriptional regulator with XRE-family HTH domain
MDDIGNAETAESTAEPGSYVAKQAPSLPVMRSEGQRLLSVFPAGVRELAEKMGWSPSTVTRLRTGARLPSPEFREAMSR